MSRRWRVARKPHRCTHCNRTIRVGESYAFKRITPWDHPDNEAFFTYRAHERCEAYWNEIGYEYEWQFRDDPEEFRRECWQYHVLKHRAERKRVVA